MAGRYGRRKSWDWGTGIFPTSPPMTAQLARTRTNRSSTSVMPEFCCGILPELSVVCREMIHSMHCGGMAKVAAPRDVECRRWW